MFIVVQDYRWIVAGDGHDERRAGEKGKGTAEYGCRSRFSDGFEEEGLGKAGGLYQGKIGSGR